MQKSPPPTQSISWESNSTTTLNGTNSIQKPSKKQTPIYLQSRGLQNFSTKGKGQYLLNLYTPPNYTMDQKSGTYQREQWQKVND